jgi:hypothetical protein
MFKNQNEEAKREIAEAYQKAKDSGAFGNSTPEGLEFGRVCVKWHDWYVIHKKKDKGDRIRFMWRALGIPHTVAYQWMGKYREASGNRPPIEQYTKEELDRSQLKINNENRLKELFVNCGFKHYIKQNCAIKEPHFNVVFTALSESEVKHLSKILRKGLKS